ncbi:hypothetical protein L198_01786 [Cryptococcus wingfieldii CBS 7118]|uniref:Inner centromere protein ARK-binding domain-containing protein n=1 Tax=Cryptococcus wingfieldii CBS 7118 TaxID=1295528 RepID=A0A1E3JW65_9TREE|nr:hypothetical protein L198_01786 [Cryptococcus wingfieldii CBS 7118]ODO05099.1 hypothetical protein L198_01786 [Cryptococcus wingfieldii CBS 7118]
MAPLTHDFPTFGHYAHNLKDGLQHTASRGLDELDQAIETKGYDWLEGYMAQIFDRLPQAPIGELIKTPSKTQTVKKTRAAIAAAKEKTEKIKGLNARLALSPSNQVNRPALSPLHLGARSININTSPSPSPVKSKPAKPLAISSPVKSKAKRGRPKKADIANDSKSTRSKKADGKQPEVEETLATEPQAQEKEDPAPQASPAKSTRSKKAKQTEVVEPPVEDVEQAVDEEERMAGEPDKESEADNAQEEPAPAPVVAEDMEVEPEPVAEREEAVEVEKQKETAGPAMEEVQQQVEEPDVPMDVEQVEDEPVAENVAPEAEPEVNREPVEEEATEPIVDKAATPPMAGIPVEEPTAPLHPEVDTRVEPEIETNTETAPEVISEPAPTNISQTSFTSNSQPAHRIRSSWLSKALGTGAPPLAHAHEPSALRKSHATSSQPDRANMDFSGLRKSLAPISGLKRKSDEGLDNDEDEDEDEHERAGKVAKASEAHTIHFPTTTPGPAKASLFPTKTPSSFGTASVGSDQHSQGRPVQDDSQRPEISRVTKALDELREKTAKDLAKQKATPAAGTAARVPQAKSTGAGFLRGLLNFGGGNAESGEDEATRRARELEEEKIAEEELEKLMWAARNGVDEDMILGEEEEEEPAPQAVEKEEPRSTTPSFSPPPKPTLRHSIHPSYMPQPAALPALVAPVSGPSAVPTAQAGTMTDHEDEEMVDEESVLDEIIPDEVTEYQPSHSRTSSQGQHTRFFSPVPASTTPAKPLDKEAPALHDRKEKHQHEPSAAVLKEQKEREEKDRRREEREQEKLRLREEKEREREKKGKGKSVQQAMETPSASHASLFTSTSANTNTTLNHASIMAAKALGVKPAAAPVKSVQQAASAAQKEQAASVRKAALREQTEKRKEQAAQKKAEEERVRAEEERKAKVAELEEKRRIRAEGEKRRKERELKAKEKAAKEQADEAAKVKAEAEAAKKRKLAAALNKSQTAAPAPKRVAAPSQSLAKGKEPFRPTKTTLSSSITADSKMGPNAFRTADSQTQSSTIRLVGQPAQPPAQRESQAATWSAPERKPLGQPSRPSQMEGHGVKQSLLYQAHHQQLQSINTQPQAPPQNWQQVQASLDKKVQQQDSEDIVLPDIASEYSDPDDDTTREFNRPDWAESPALNKALAAQATIDPDEYFGHIGPLNMEELFKARAGKFRPRSSSANWSRGDGLSPMEIIDYAKRMGYESLQSYDDGPGPSGSS